MDTTRKGGEAKNDIIWRVKPGLRGKRREARDEGE